MNTGTRGEERALKQLSALNVNIETDVLAEWNSEWWTSLGTSHNERIMTAIARSKGKGKGKVQSNGKMQR